jgi:hypothetical protein
VTFPFHVDPTHKGETDEIGIQVLFRNRMRVLAPTVMLVGIPNAGRRTAWEGRQRGREGMVPGFPDIMALHDGRAAFLEFKKGSGSLQANQVDVLNRLVRLDFAVGVFRDADSAVEWLQGHWPTAFVGRLAA